MASVLIVPKVAFRIVRGELKSYAVKADSGNEVAREFCANCGSGILSRLAGMPEVIAVKAGSLDNTSGFKPTMNIYVSSAPRWATFAAELDRFDKMPV